jgi:hypothetical protein
LDTIIIRTHAIKPNTDQNPGILSPKKWTSWRGIIKSKTMSKTRIP